MPTNKAFLDAVQGLTPQGVRRIYAEPPRQVNTAELPVSFPLMPSGSLGEKSVSCYSTNKTRSIGYVVCLEPVGQGTQPQNYALLATTMDHLETALDTLEKSQDAVDGVANFIEYDISAVIFTIAGTDYWAIEATVSARDI